MFLGDLSDGISHIPFGLPKYVNDEHNWSARGTLLFHPPGSELNVYLNGHGSRLAQDSVLGQAIGTQPLQGATDRDLRFAGFAGGIPYVDRDVQEEFNELCGEDLLPGPSVKCSNSLAQKQLVKNIAQGRPLDIRPYRGDYDRVGQTTRDTWGGFVSGEGEVFADTKLFGLASYDGYERLQDVDSDFTPENLFETVQGDKAWQTYDELHLDGELEAEPVEWHLGGYYLREELDNDGTTFLYPDYLLPSQRDLIKLNTRRIYSQNIDSLAGWGEFSWDFADDFTLEGGVRYNWERKEFEFEKIGGTVVGGDVRAREHAIFDAPTGQLILTYRIDPDNAAYARYTRGFKAGHYNALASQTGAEERNGTFRVPPAKEEYNDAWEVGTRTAWLDRRVQLAGSFFYYRYENY